MGYPNRFALSAAILGSALLVSAPALADDYDIKVIEGQPTADQLMNSLVLPPKARGIRKASKPKAVALQIQFEFGCNHFCSQCLAGAAGTREQGGDA